MNGLLLRMIFPFDFSIVLRSMAEALANLHRLLLLINTGILYLQPQVGHQSPLKLSKRNRNRGWASVFADSKHRNKPADGTDMSEGVLRQCNMAWQPHSSCKRANA